MHAVQIGYEFFKNIKRDYSNPDWAIVREFFQNGRDAGSKHIDFAIRCLGVGRYELTVTNDGKVMDKDTLVNKLLCMGGTTKGTGDVGGFGVAKMILYFCHERYSIRTGDLLVEGSGGQYSLSEGLEFVGGTVNVVVMDKDLSDKVREYASMVQWDGVVTLNGEVLNSNLHKGKPRKRLLSGQLYSNRSFKNRLIVRVNGTPMFREYVSWDRCVILELDAEKSKSLMSSNRDSLTFDARMELREFLDALASDDRTAFKVQDPRYTIVEGNLLSSRKFNLGGELPYSGAVGRELTHSPSLVTTALRLMDSGASAATVDGFVEEVVQNVLNHRFIIKNVSSIDVPEYYIPSSDVFSSYARKLAVMWTRLIFKLHVLFKVQDTFCTGFMFDNGGEEGAVAEFESKDRRKVYYLNPAELVTQSSSESKSFRKAWKLTERDRLLAYAVHEFVHGAYGLMAHNESFAAKLTECMSVVMKNRKLFNPCFAGVENTVRN